MKSRYQMFAGYNAWCNERLYDAAEAMAPGNVQKTPATPTHTH